jgi:hypothetical protein
VTKSTRDKNQDRLDKRAAALKANMMRRKERMKEIKQQGKDNDEHNEPE